MGLPVVDAVDAEMIAGCDEHRDAEGPGVLQRAVHRLVACWVQLTSAVPQLIEMTLGLLTVSCAAACTASTNPWKVFGAK